MFMGIIPWGLFFKLFGEPIEVVGLAIQAIGLLGICIYLLRMLKKKNDIDNKKIDKV